jgi:hemoglobin
MHKGDLETIKDKLSLFLMGWLGGPRLYADKYGSISIPQAHQHLGAMLFRQELDKRFTPRF